MIEKPTNLSLHAIYGGIAGIIAVILLKLTGLAWFYIEPIMYGLLGLCFVAVMFREMMQYDNAWNQTDYLRRKWLDCIADIFAAMIPFGLCLWIGSLLW